MQELIETGLKDLGIDAKQDLCSAYLTYIDLLIKWNKAYNLTAIREPEAIALKHVLDSLSVYSYIKGDRCLDVGTGAGLPGLILALAQPDKNWTLLDSNQKKLRFIQHVKVKLNINNINIVNARVEKFKSEELFHTIICRAFSSLHNFHNACHHLLDEKGILLAMKATLDGAELNEAKSITHSLEIKELHVPGLMSERSLVMMSG